MVELLENAFGLLMSLNMLIEFGDAFDFTGADFAGWCKEVGFKKIDVMPLAGPTSAGVARKLRARRSAARRTWPMPWSRAAMNRPTSASRKR